MFDKVLNMPLDYLSCFAIVPREIHRNVDICQTDYSIHSKLEFFLYSEVINGSTTFTLMKGQRLKKNDQLFNLMFLFFHFLHSNVPGNKCHRMHPLAKWGAKKIWLWGIDFKSWGDLNIRRGLNFQRGAGELNSQRELDSGGLQCFSATMLFLWQHYYKLFISLCIL